LTLTRGATGWAVSSPGPELGRRATDRQPATSANVEAMIANAKVGAPTLYRVFSSIGSAASTVILAIVGFAWSEVRDEWHDLKAQIADIRRELDRQPSPEEFDKVRDKVEQINDRLIRIEARFDE
jgi:hypothetical protein